ncbi:Tetratricopeptide-like helical [Corchorus capsularis]|uniref:Tetratricopeptide-like helical n=1 Tax=Corchorus capsularis TaxID=210143 RepID=A0A1R3GCI4_COCAP|nr:Tetratricopeptide-like helical [Corchorus capsularis]
MMQDVWNAPPGFRPSKSAPTSPAKPLGGNLGWALMQQNNYIEAEDAYRRALSIAPDNNKMCNLGICLMKQGRIGEAKETLRRVKPAVADGPRGVDSHLKAYERAQQMLMDLESEMMNKGGDRVEQSRLFDAFLGSSSIWQPQPCKDTITLPLPTANTVKPVPHDDFADENINSNIMGNQGLIPSAKPVPFPFGNSLNIDARPFYSTKFVKEPVVKEPIGTGNQLQETLKRTRSGNSANSMRVNEMGDYNTKTFSAEVEKPEVKTRRLFHSSEERGEDKLADLLPDSEDFEEAIIAAVLGPANETTNNPRIFPKKIDKRLKVFQDITLSLSPRA